MTEFEGRALHYLHEITEAQKEIMQLLRQTVHYLHNLDQKVGGAAVTGPSHQKPW